MKEKTTRWKDYMISDLYNKNTIEWENHMMRELDDKKII